MGTIKPSTYIAGALIFMFFMIGGITLIGVLNDEDSTFTAGGKFDQFNSTFVKLDDITSNIDDMEGDVVDIDSGSFGVWGVLNSLISSAWSTIRLMFTSFTFMDDVFSGLSTVFGVPAWIPTIILALITVGLIFAIFSAIFQRDV